MFVTLGSIIHVLAWLVGFWDLKLSSAEEGFPLRDFLNILCFFRSVRFFVVCVVVLVCFFSYFCPLVVVLVFVQSVPNEGVLTSCH